MTKELMRTEEEWNALGYYVIPNAPIVWYNKYNTPMYSSSWVGVDEDIPW